MAPRPIIRPSTPESTPAPEPEPAPVLPYGAPLLSAAAYGLIVSERKYITSGSVAL